MLGASVGNIITILSKDFIKLAAIAIVVSFPVAWLSTEKWLERFAYRTDTDAGIYVAAGSLTVLLAIVTVSFQAIKAAMANPVKSLRTE